MDVGPDGFVSAHGNPDHVLHALVNAHLDAQEKLSAAAGHLRAPNISQLKKLLSKPQLIALIKAVLGRIQWIQQNANELPRGREWQRHLFALVERLYALKLPYTENDLRDLLRMTASLSGVIPPYGPVEQVIAFVREHALTQQLCAELRNLQASLREEMSINQPMAQLLRQRLHMLLWHDEWDALDPKHCWSEEIRRTYRAMSGDRRAKWRALLYHIRGDAGTKPPASWSTEAELRLAQVGIEDVRDCFSAWFVR